MLIVLTRGVSYSRSYSMGMCQLWSLFLIFRVFWFMPHLVKGVLTSWLGLAFWKPKAFLSSTRDFMCFGKFIKELLNQRRSNIDVAFCGSFFFALCRKLLHI